MSKGLILQGQRLVLQFDASEPGLSSGRAAVSEPLIAPE